MPSNNTDKKLDQLLSSIGNLIYILERKSNKDDPFSSVRRGYTGEGEDKFLRNRSDFNSTDFNDLMNNVMKSFKDNLKDLNEDLRKINKELATTTDSNRKKVLQREKEKTKKSINKIKGRINKGSENEYERRNRAAKGQLIQEYNSSTSEIKQRYGSAENYVNYKQRRNEYLESTKNRNDARRMVYESGLGNTTFGRFSNAAMDRQQKIADLSNFSERMKYGGSEKLASAMFGKGKGGIVAKGLGGLGKAAGIASKALTKLAGPISILIDILSLLGGAAKAVAEADAKQQEIQNKRNTTLTNRNIELSNIETEGITDTVSTFGENAISQYNMMFTKVAGELQIASTKAIAGVQLSAESAIGDANKAAWNAFNTQVDIEKQQANLNAEITKTNAVEGRNIAQRTLEFTGRDIERSYQSQNAVLQADIENSRLNMEDIKNTYDNPISSTINRGYGKLTGNPGAGSTVADNIQGNDKWNKKYGENNNSFISDSVGGYAAAGAVNMIPIVGSVTKGFGDAYITKQNTLMEKGITDATNSFNAMSAAAKNQIQVNNQVMATTNQVANTVTEGVAELTKIANETDAEIQKAWAAMTQSVEEYFKNFQKIAFNTGIGQGITTRDQLDSYFKNMLSISSNVSRNYGLTSEEVMRMQQDYTAGGRNKILSENDYNAQAALGKQLLGGDFGTAAELSNNTEIFNMGVEQTVNLTGEMYKQVTKMGLDGRKYIKDLTKNLKAAQKYDFKNGVKGLMNMAAKAQNIRFNMDSLDNILDDLQGGGLENLITKAAKLQVMGGHFAMGADPIAMMYEAFSDPEALMARFNDMLNGMGSMDTETGKVNFSGNEQMMLRNFAQITGQSLEDVRAQATYKVKKDKVEPFITDSNLSKEQRASLVNKAYKDENGEWMVNNIYGKAMNLSDVNSNNIKDVEASTYEGKMEEGMRHVVAFTDKFIGSTDANNAILAKAADENGDIQRNFQERLDTQLQDLKNRLDDYSTKIIEYSTKATKAFETIPSLYSKTDAKDIAEKSIDQLKSFAQKTETQLNDILKKMGGNATAAANNNEKASKLKNITVGVQGKGNENKRVNMADILKSGIAYEYDGGIRINNAAFAKTYGGKANYGKWTKDQIKKAGGYSFAESTALTKQQQQEIDKKKQQLSLKDDKIRFYQNKGMKEWEGQSQADGVAFGNGKPLFTQASQITKIHDGSAQITQSDPHDTALFAKTGGPFDTLFNGVFNRVDDLYNTFVEPRENTKANVEPMSNLSNNRENGINGQSQTIRFDTLKVDLSGKLELMDNNGKNVNIIGQIQNDPIFIRSLSQMLSQHISAAINGGRGYTYNMIGTV